MTDLWAPKREAARQRVEPLAVRMRPRTLDEFVGQGHILGPGCLLRRMIEADAITSIILHGPPGTGKTTLARVIAAQTRRRFVAENAAAVGVKRIREVIDEATRAVELEGRRTILFLDEIHRFTRSQQDVLLNDVERGLVTLIGATTENPFFACNSALVSRSTLFRLEPLSEEEVAEVVRRAIADPERGYGRLDLRVADDAIRVWAVKSDGDARRALNALEVAVLSQQNRARSASECRSPQQNGAQGARESRPSIVIDRAVAEDSIQQKAAVYDGTGDEHYDAISALIKSIRGSDPDAAVYWIARMLDAGEDPRYIARRLSILASEDIGNADPHAMPLAAACWHLVERVGMPECRLTLSQCAIYLALAPKSNASCVAIDEAMADVREGRTVPVPLYLRDPNSSPIGEGVKMRDRPGEKYQYSHDAPDAFTGQDYLGVEKRYYRPTDRGDEKRLGERLAELRRLREHIRGAPPRGEP